jgi:hypothetical protein
MENISNFSVFVEAMRVFSPFSVACACCHSMGRFVPHGGYQRYLVSLENGLPVSKRLDVKRVRCVCGHTHGLLSAFIVPYSQYGVTFQLTVLSEYYNREPGVTVRTLCERYQISTSTLYNWRDRFLYHAKLLLGVLKARAVSTKTLAREMLNLETLTNHLFHFLETHRCSFLQTGHLKTPQCWGWLRSSF